MAGPWEQYQTQAGPWTQYQSAAPPAPPQAAPQKASGPPVLQPVNDFLAPGKAVLAHIRDNFDKYQQDPNTYRAPTSVGDAAHRMFVQGPSDVWDEAKTIFGGLTAPIAGLTNQAVNPLARAGAALGIGNEQDNERMLNTALAGAKPGAAGVPRLAAAPRLPTPAQQAVAAFDRAGVQPSLATAAGGRGTAALTNVIAENPVAGVATRGRLRAQHAQAGAKAADLASQYGTVSAPQLVGENIQAGVQRFANDRTVPGNPNAPAGATSFSAKAGAMYDDVFSQIEQAQAAKMAQNGGVSPVRASQTEATLGALANRANGQLGALISDPRLKSIADALTADRGTTTFGDLRALRTWVREAQRNPQLRQGMDDASLQSLERALTGDIQANAETLAGPQVAAKLRRVDQYYAAGSQRIKNALQPFDNAASGESAYQRIVQAAGSTGSADAQRLLSLKRSLRPDEWGDVAANVLNGLGKPTAGNAGMDEGAFSISTFLTNYSRMSPRARDILFGSVGGGGPGASNLRGELDNLANVVGRMKSVERGANTSKTAVGGQAIATLGAGSIVSWPVTIKVLGTMAGAGEVLTNPAFVRWLASASKTGELTRANLAQLNGLAKASPSIGAYRQSLVDFLGGQGQQNGQPVGQNVPAPQIPALTN